MHIGILFGLITNQLAAPLPVPAITSATLDQVDTSGGDSVVFTGTDLDSASSLTYNGVTCTITGNTSTTITATLPDVSTPGTYDVVATTLGGSSSGFALEAWDPRAASAVWWLRADKGVTLNSGNVSAWADQSGLADSNRDAVEANAANQPLFNSTDAPYNNKATIGTFATASCNLTTGSTWSASYSTFTLGVIGHTSASGNRYFTYASDSDYIALLSSGGTPTVFSGAAATFIQAGSGQDVEACLTMCEFNGASSNLFINATATATGSGTLTAATLGDETVRLGSYIFGAGNAVTKIAEVFAFSGVLSGGNKTKLRKYLNLRYGKSMTN